MSIDVADVAPMLAEVGSFARERIARAANRPETPIAIAELEKLTSEARALGILPAAVSPAAVSEDGFGLWEDCDQPHAMMFNIGVLRHVGYANPGVAFTWHRHTLARLLERSLGLEPAQTDVLGSTMVPTGHYGLARASLPKWLRGVGQQPEELDLLADWLDRNAHGTVLIAPDTWKTVLWPVWENNSVGWERVSRRNLDVQPRRHQHGLDEISSFHLHGTSQIGEKRPLQVDASRQLYSRILKMDMIALLAIGAGAIARGQEMAKEYAATRKQGGKLIGNHSAVQQMLSDIARSRHNAELALQACEQPMDELDLGEVAASRSSIHAMLCHAADQVVQVFGGLGYIRDTGAEKIQRDMNMLKLQTGGTRDLTSFLAGWSGDSQ